jgi:metal-responsive CopG/Arc/MetJ family transcriptional regulator
MKTEPVSRISISLPGPLLRQLDEMARAKGYGNRSLAIADQLIAAKGVKHGRLTVTTTGHDLPG